MPIRYQEGKIGYGMLDTGAAINTVSTQLAERWGLEILESESTGIWGITGRYVSSRGRIDIIINIFGDSFRLHAEVIDSQEEIILGLPFLRANQILIDLSKETLRFTFSAETNTKIPQDPAVRQGKGRITSGENVSDIKTESDSDALKASIKLFNPESKTVTLTPVDEPLLIPKSAKEPKIGFVSEKDKVNRKMKLCKRPTKPKKRIIIEKRRYPFKLSVNTGRVDRKKQSLRPISGGKEGTAFSPDNGFKENQAKETYGNESQTDQNQTRNSIALGTQETLEKPPMLALVLEKTKPTLTNEYYPRGLADQNESKDSTEGDAKEPSGEKHITIGKSLRERRSEQLVQATRVGNLGITASGTRVPHYVVKGGKKQINHVIQSENNGGHDAGKLANEPHEPHRYREISNAGPTQVVHLNKVKNSSPARQYWRKNPNPKPRKKRKRTLEVIPKWMTHNNYSSDTSTEDSVALVVPLEEKRFRPGKIPKICLNVLIYVLAYVFTLCTYVAQYRVERKLKPPFSGIKHTLEKGFNQVQLMNTSGVAADMKEGILAAPTTIGYDGHITRRPVPSELPRPPEPTGIPYGKSVVSVAM